MLTQAVQLPAVSAAASSAGPWPGLRVTGRSENTRERLLAAARAVLAEVGAQGFTYSAVAARAGASRQTLYNNWSSRELLLAEAMLSAPDVAYPQMSPDAGGFDVHRLVSGYLRSLRDGITSRGVAEAFAAMVHTASTNQQMAEAVAAIPVDRCAALSGLLQPAGVQISQDDFTSLCGPVLYRIFYDRIAVNDEFIHHIVSSWVLSRSRVP